MVRLAPEVLDMSFQIRVLSYNTHKSTGVEPDQLRAAIRSTRSDLVFLQEVVGSTQPVQFEYFADSVWPHYAYGKNSIYSNGHHGNAILSLYPFQHYENIWVGAHSKFDPRGILHGQIQVPVLRHPIHVLSLHFGLLEMWRKKQIQKLCERISTHIPPHHPVIIAGDFNDWQERTTHFLEKNLRLKEAFQSRNGKHARTFPARFPFLCLDRIYFRGFEVVEAQVLQEDTAQNWKSLSDHLPLMVDLKLQ